MDPDGRKEYDSTEESVIWTADEVLDMSRMQITFLSYRDPEKPNNNWEDHPVCFFNMPFIKN